MSVSPDQRYTRWHPCPICEGYASLPHGKGVRCMGILSDDGNYAYCSREEWAGTLERNGPPDNDTYCHRLHGSCKCGHPHGAFTPTAPTRRKDTTPKPPTWRRGAFPSTYDASGTYVAEWHYHDASGMRRYSVVRYDLPDGGKTYPQARWRDDGQQIMWAWGLGEAERLLYRLPELCEAPASRPVFIVEGEKCAEALRGLGLVVTTCSEGAGKWRQVPGRHDALRGRHVVILPDHDEPGKAHARDIAADLADVAASVRIVELPDLAAHSDVVDWLDVGGTKDELLELVIIMSSPASAATAAWAQKDAMPDAGAAAGALRARERALQLANERRRELETKDAWNTACKANPHLSATTKLVASAVRDELERAKKPEGEELTVYLPKLAKRAGVSSQTAGEALKKLAEAGTIERRLEMRIGTGGLKVSRVKVCPTELFKTPAKWKPPTPRNHGGKRCPHCGSSRVQVRPQYRCQDCGSIWHGDKWQTIPTSAESAASPDIERDGGLFTGSQVDSPLPEGNEKAGPVELPGEADAVCAVCGSCEIEVYDPYGRPYCAEHVPREATAEAG